MNKNRPFFYAGLVGVLMLVYACWLFSVFPKEASFMPEGITTPIVCFEFIQTPVEVNGLFGVNDNSFNGESFITKMDKGNKIDFGFAFIYSAFLFLFFYCLVRLAKEPEKKWYKAGMFLAILAFVCDVFENIQLLGITANLQSGEFGQHLKLLGVFTWLKWGGIVLCFSLYGLWLIKSKGGWRFFGYLTFIPFLLGVMAFLHKGFMSELFVQSTSIVFFVFMVYCFVYKSDKNPG